MNEHDVKSLVSDLSSIDGIFVSETFPVRTRKYAQGYRVYAKYIFDDQQYAQNLETLVKNGCDKNTVLEDRGECVKKFMDSAIRSIIDKYSNLNIAVNHKLWGIAGHDVWDEVTLTVKPASGIAEDLETELEIPAPYNQYYEFSPNEVNFDELPDAFDHYKDLKVIAELYAKEQYEDALADNCLDFCWLVEDEIGKLLLVTTAGLRVYPITLEEIQNCVGDGSSDNYFDFDEGYTGEPSSTEYGDAVSRYFREMTDAIEKYNIRKIGRKRSIEYDGVVNGHKFFFVEGNTGTGHYAKELYIDGKEVNLYQSKESERSFAYLNEMNQFGILSLVKMLENDNLSGIVYRDVDTLDDYEEGLVEDVEMSDAQRLALQELDSCLECGELTAEKHALAYQIQWDINFEDVLLFINGIDADLKDIKHVEYGDCDETKFDGCYSVTFHNGDVKNYGWHDFDMTGSLTCIDCNEGILSAITGMTPVGLTEDVDDGWEKPFDWTERYVKDGFVIYNNYQGAWHLEQTRPKTKHFGNYKTLEAAKAAGDKEIAARENKNRGKKPQFGVHRFSTDSIIFRGTEAECGKYIDDREELWDDAEVYMMTPSDPHYLQEGTGSDTAHVIRDVLTTASKEDKDGWTKTIADIIDVIPDQYIDDLYDITSEKLKDVKVTDAEKKKILDASGSDIDLNNDFDTVGKILALFDVQSWDAATLKKFVLVVLGIVAVIEPTPILEIVTAVVSLLPADIVKTILSITNTIGNPVGAIGTIANRAYQSSKNEDYARVDAKDFVKHPMNYDVTSMLEFEVQDDVKVYIHRGPGRQREFYIIIGDAYVQHAFNKLETVEKYLRRNNLVKEVISESFKPGDVVYVTVCNRQGRVRKMISPDVVEVELHDNGVYPERIDRYYVDEVELQYSDDLDDEF